MPTLASRGQKARTQAAPPASPQEGPALIPSSQAAGSGQGTISPPTIKNHITRGVEPAAFHRGVCSRRRGWCGLGTAQPPRWLRCQQGLLGEDTPLQGLDCLSLTKPPRTRLPGPSLAPHRPPKGSCPALPTGSHGWGHSQHTEAAGSGSSVRAGLGRGLECARVQVRLTPWDGSSRHPLGTMSPESRGEAGRGEWVWLRSKDPQVASPRGPGLNGSLCPRLTPSSLDMG